MNANQLQIQAKYERLVDAHKRLQRNNICLEEKLLKVNQNLYRFDLTAMV